MSDSQDGTSAGGDTIAQLQKRVNYLFVRKPLSHHEPFSEFSDENAKEMTEFLLELHRTSQKNPDKFGSISDVINQCENATTKNPRLVRKALAIFLTHSPIAQDQKIYVPPLKVQRANEKPPEGPHALKICPVTADTLKGYNIISYFREDNDLNDHHMHWHQVYPWQGLPEGIQKCDRSEKHVRALDREGELFLYMHSQMLARYNAELVSWNLDIVQAWGFRDVATFGYTPPPSLQKPPDKPKPKPFRSRSTPVDKHTKPDKSEYTPEYNPGEKPDKPTYTVRPPHTSWPESGISIATMEKWRNNILKAIENESIKTVKADQTTGKQIAGKLKLKPEDAMNWIGMITEALRKDLMEVEQGSGEFADRDYYGSLHNTGHDKFSAIPPAPGVDHGDGVMGHPEVAVRDHVFWMWHKHIDDFRLAIIKKYEHSIEEFKPEVKITRLAILPRYANSKTPPGGLSTILGPPQLYLDESTAKIDHEPYKWEINVESTRAAPPTTAKPQTFTVRLFIVPKEFIHDERSWIEMDKFTYHLTTGSATITRLDNESSVARVTLDLKPGEEHRHIKDYHLPQCLCGWPQNMMLPAGRPDGMEFVAFAMLTNDKLNLGDGEPQSISFCGARNKVYPDPRGMGYPFDKKWSTQEYRYDSSDMFRAAHEVELAASDTTPHMKVTNFKIYRTTNKQVSTTPATEPPQSVEVEETDFFRPSAWEKY